MLDCFEVKNREVHFLLITLISFLSSALSAFFGPFNGIVLLTNLIVVTQFINFIQGESFNSLIITLSDIK